jgi:hypothetical protein
MDKDKNLITISCDAMLNFAQKFSNKDVKYALLKNKYDIQEQENLTLKQQLEEERRARIAAEKEVAILKAELKLQKDERHPEPVNKSGQPSVSEQQEAVEYMIGKDLMLSILQIKVFMEHNAPDLYTTSMLRTFIWETVPENYREAAYEVIKKIMTLPEAQKPQPINDNRTINLVGDHPKYDEHKD